jgi:hypothetical protein
VVEWQTRRTLKKVSFEVAAEHFQTASASVAKLVGRAFSYFAISLVLPFYTGTILKPILKQREVSLE